MGKRTRGDAASVSQERKALAAATLRRGALRAKRGPFTDQGSAFLTRLLDAVGQAVIGTNRAGQIVHWNRFAEQLYGWCAAEVMGKSILEVLLQENAHGDGRAMMSAVCEGHHGRGEWLVRRKDGTQIPVRTTTTGIVDELGHVIGMVGVSLDLSESKRLQEELHESATRLRLFAEQLPALAWATDEEFNVIWTQGAALRTLGPEPPSLVGKTIAEAVRLGKSRPVAIDAHRRALAGETVAYEGGKGDTVMQALVQPFRDSAGRIAGTVGVALDVTDRKRAEEELARRVDQQAAVAQLGLRALEGADLQGVLEEAVRLTGSSFGVEFCDVLEMLPNGNFLMRAGRGWRLGIVGKAVLSGGVGSQHGFALASEDPVVVEDLRTETRFAASVLLLDQGVVSGIIVPIRLRDRVFGMLGVYSVKRRAYTRDDLNCLRSVVNTLVAAIERQRVEIELREKREQLQALSRRLLEAQEAERRAVARELHDDFGQVLSAIRLNLQTAQRHTGTDGEEHMAESLALVDQAIDRMRSLALELRPSILDDLGLVSALRWLLKRQSERAGFEGTFEVRSLGGRLPSAVETCCFRVAQEALTNIARHAETRHVTLELAAAGGQVEILVRDDGKGFDVGVASERASRGESLGLLSMRERVSLAGGRFHLESALGCGTVVRARFPLTDEAT